MAELREKILTVNIEPTFGELLAQLAQKLGTSSSAHVRALIIHDLMQRGVVTDEVLQRVVVG